MDSVPKELIDKMLQTTKMNMLNANMAELKVTETKTDDKVSISNVKKTKKKKSKKIKNNRCFGCNKRVGIMGYTCECSAEKRFCHDCLTPDVHNCTVDHAAKHKAKLTKENQRVVADKLRDRLD